MIYLQQLSKAKNFPFYYEIIIYEMYWSFLKIKHFFKFLSCCWTTS